MKNISKKYLVLSAVLFMATGARASDAVKLEIVSTQNGKPLEHDCVETVGSEIEGLYVPAYNHNGACPAERPQSTAKSPEQALRDMSAENRIHRVDLGGVRKDIRSAAFKKFISESQGSYELRYEQRPTYKTQTPYEIVDLNTGAKKPNSEVELHVPASAITIVDKSNGRKMPLNDFIDNLMLRQGTYYSGVIGTSLLAMDELRGNVRKPDVSRASDSPIKSVSSTAQAGAAATVDAVAIQAK